MFLVQRLREKFFTQRLSEFDSSLPQSILDIEYKTRSNIFAWRGQFSPQLIEELLLSYCPKNAIVLDPFAGSGTVLYESACFGITAFGCEVNPAAWILSRTYEISNIEINERKQFIRLLAEKLEEYFPKPKLFDREEFHILDLDEFKQAIFSIYAKAESFENIVLDTLVILLDLANNSLTRELIHNTFYKICQVIRELPYSDKPINTYLGDARNIPLETEYVDFVVTSPPYINVFNYHQNYRRSAEILGWDLLKIAKSEIGSNRANRSNRFLTVIQYCLDIACVLKELQRVCKHDARVIFVVGHESNVLGVPFYNAKIISDLATRAGVFELVLTQKRNFKNKFGKLIREDLLNFFNKNYILSGSEWDEIARNVAYEVLNDGLRVVPEKNKYALVEAIEKVPDLGKSPLLSPSLCSLL